MSAAAEVVDTHGLSRTRTAIGIAVVVVVFIVAAWTVWHQREPLEDSLALVGLWPVIASLVCAVLGVGVTYMEWFVVLNGLRAPIPIRDGARVYFVSQLGKYLPGSVWPAVMQMEAGRRHGVQRTTMLTANLFTLALGCAVGMAGACVLLPFSAPGALERYWWMLLALPLLLALMHPSTLPRILSFALSSIGRPPVSAHLPWRHTMRAVWWAIASFVLLGVSVALIVAPLNDWNLASLPLSIGAISLAVCIGVLAIPVPAGVGVRDAVMVIVLSTTLGTASALLVAISTRALFSIADLVLAVAIPPLTRRGGTHNPYPGEDDPLDPTPHTESDRRPQLAYSEIQNLTHDAPRRRLKAAKITAVLEHFFGGDSLAGLAALDIGASTGYTVEALAHAGATVTGVDIDVPGIAHARERFGHLATFEVADGSDLPYPDASFDIVVLNHIYEHVVDADAVMSEIRRVLKPDGAVFLGLGNKWQIIEPHYRLPFLSWLPEKAADLYVSKAGKADTYYERFRSKRALIRMCAGLKLWDYTYAVLGDPESFHATDVLPKGLAGLPPGALKALDPVMPTFIWVGTPGDTEPRRAAGLREAPRMLNG